MAEAKVDLSSDATQLLKTLRAVEGGFMALVKQMERLETESKKSETTTSHIYSNIASGAKSAARDIMGIATAWLSVQGVTRLASAEFDKYYAKLNTSAGTATQFNRNISASLQNTDRPRERVEGIALGAATQAGVSPIMTSAALPSTFAAGAEDMSDARVQGFVAASAAVSPDSQEDFNAISSGSVAFASLLPGGENLSPQQLLGFLIKASKGTATDRLQFYAPQIAKVAAGARSYNLDVPESIAIFNAISRGIKDETGELSRTQTLSILKALADVRDSKKLKTNKPTEILAYVLGKPAVARKVVDEMNTRAPTEGFVGSVFTNGGIGQQFLGDAFASVPTVDGSAEAYASHVANMGNSSLAAAGRAAQAISGAGEVGLLGDAQQAETGLVRQAYESWLASGNQWAAGDVIDKGAFDVATGLKKQDATDYLRGVLSAKARDHRAPQRFGDWETGYVESPATKESIAMATAIEKLIVVLDQIDQRQKQTQMPDVKTNGDRPTLPGQNQPPSPPANAPDRPGQY